MRIKADHIGVVCAIVGLVMNAYKIIWCWPVYMLSNVLFIIHFAPKKERPYIFLMVVYFVLNIYGWIKWSI